jgi:Asp-tRNA(Asn)/Glu-tRNA(Gln) amidotransferase A subunit family amidase
LASCIARIETVDHAVNAIPERDFDRASDAAQRADAAVVRHENLPALHGLPIGIKDLQETKDLVTTRGSVIYKDNVPVQNDCIVAAARRAGAIVIGKTNTPESGAGANTRNAVYGATSNPFDPAKSAAGSSGGSAVALATGMVPICTGSDTGGTLRNPAAFSGIVGFRPPPGLVPTDKRPIGWSNLPVLGPMARTVADTCLLLGAIASDDVRDTLAYSVHGRSMRYPEEFYPPAAIDLSRLLVALTPDFGFAPPSAISPRRSRKNAVCSAMCLRALKLRRRIVRVPMKRLKSCDRWPSWPPRLTTYATGRATSAPMCTPTLPRASVIAPPTWRGR